MSSQTPELKAVIFDLYETLVTEFDPQWQPPTPSIAERLGITEAAMDEGWRRVHDARMRGVVSFREALHRICRFGGRAGVDTAVIDALERERYEEKREPFRAVSGEIIAMLRDLRSRSLKLCVISNAAAEETDGWWGSELRGHFDAAVFSYEAGLLKPEWEIYGRGCALLGIEPRETAFVGDGGADELRGAARAGLRPVWATWFLDQWPQGVRHGYADHGAEFPRVRVPRDMAAALGLHR